MNALFFEQLLGYADLGVVNFRVQADTIYLDCISNLSQGINTQTMEKSTKAIDTRQREVREMSILGKKVVLNIKVRKFKTSSNTYFWEELSMVRVGSHCTKRYEQHIFDSCQRSDMSRIALQQEVGLDSIMGIYHLYAKKTLYHRPFSKVRRLGMDETRHFHKKELTLKYRNFVLETQIR